MKKQEVHDDEQQEIKETNSTTNRGWSGNQVKGGQKLREREEQSIKPQQ